MNTDLESIKATLVNISKGENILDMLTEFERTLDNAEVFAYKNWILGELVEGPDIQRYWFKVSFMYPYKKMPDPDGALRLTKIGAMVNYRKGIFKAPVKVTGPKDWVDPQTKRAKMAEHKIWIVTIQMPMKYITQGADQISQTMHNDVIKTNMEIAGAFDQQSESDDTDLDQTGEIA